jgi:hypothetical protein
MCKTFHVTGHGRRRQVNAASRSIVLTSPPATPALGYLCGLAPESTELQGFALLGNDSRTVPSWY